MLYLIPGIGFTTDAGLHAFAFVELPVYQYVNGLQLTPKHIFSVGASCSFR